MEQAARMFSSPFNEAQQVQLRAQIIVFGSILRDRVPEETLMSLSFADISKGLTVEDFHEGNLRRSFWEEKWRAATKRPKRLVQPPSPPPPLPSPPLSKQPKPQRKPAPKAKPAPVPKKKRTRVFDEPELETMAASVLANDLIGEDKTTTSASDGTESEDGTKNNSESNGEERPVFGIDEDQFAPGTEVEVLAAEDGLRGVWFSAEVLGVEENMVHVRYDDLVETGIEAKKLEEWVPYHAPKDPAPRVRLPHPVTSAEVPIKGKLVSVGEHVDVWLNDGWWEGVVVGVDSERDMVTLFYPGGGDTNSVMLCNLRRSLEWRNGKWVPWTPESRSKTDLTKPPPPPARTSAAKVEVRKKKIEAPPIILDGKRRRAKPKRLADALDEEEEEDEEDGRPAKKSRAAKSKSTPASRKNGRRR